MTYNKDTSEFFFWDFGFTPSSHVSADNVLYLYYHFCNTTGTWRDINAPTKTITEDRPSCLSVE